MCGSNWALVGKMLSPGAGGATLPSPYSLISADAFSFPYMTTPERVNGEYCLGLGSKGQKLGTCLQRGVGRNFPTFAESGLGVELGISH